MNTVLDLAKAKAQAEITKVMSALSVLEDNNFLPYEPLKKIQSATTMRELLNYYWDTLGFLDRKLQTLDRISRLFESLDSLEGGEKEHLSAFPCQVSKQDIIETAYEDSDYTPATPCPLFVQIKEGYVIVCSKGGPYDLQIYLPTNMSHWNGALEVKVKYPQKESQWGLYSVTLHDSGYMQLAKLLSGTDLWSPEVADGVSGLLMDYVEALQLVSIHTRK